MKSNRFNYQNLRLGSGLGRLIQDAFEGLEDIGSAIAGPVTSNSIPKMDLHEDEHQFVALLEVPGVKKSDLKVEVVDGVLEIGASVSQETSDGRKNIPLERSIPLPDQIGHGEVRAKLEDGILTVTLPKHEAVKPRTINVE